MEITIKQVKEWYDRETLNAWISKKYTDLDFQIMIKFAEYCISKLK